MKNKTLLSFLLVLVIAAPAVLAQEQENRPPVAEPIRAELTPPTTIYKVAATDPDGDPLSFAWSGEISCGSFMYDESTARWDHPHGNKEGMCPERSTSHPGTISVIISDGNGGIARCTYEGSEEGVGPICKSSTGMGSVSQTYSGLWYTICYWLWLPLLVAAIALGSWLWKNGLFANASKNPCEKEKLEEAAARARMNSAKKNFDDIDQAKRSADEADRKARDAEAKAEHLRRAAGSRWSASGSTDWEGQHTEVHHEGWHDKEAGAKADEAKAAADAARAAADQAKSKFDSMGGNSAHAQARREMDEARNNLEKAESALKVCLEQLNQPALAQPTPPVTTAPTPPPSTPPPTTPGPTGPVTSTPQPTQARVCIDGERRNERTQSITVKILDLESVKLMQDRIYSDAGNEAMKFVDYLQTLKDLFNLGKKIKGGVSGFMEGSISGGADAVGFPDFFEWYDGGIDALTRSMHHLHELILDKQRLGEYWLEYRYKNLTMTCRSYDICHNNGWIRRCELTLEDGGMANGRTDPQSVHDIRELRPAITRLFNNLRSRFSPDKNRAKEFTDSCNRCQ